MSMIFDARQYAPQQGFPAHPPGKFRAMIVNTENTNTKEGTGGMLAVDFQTDAGRITKRYNLWNQSAEAVRIANQELSALCHAIGQFQLDLSNAAPQLRNAQCIIEVSKQANSDYMQVSHVYDLQGNEPGKAPQGQLMAQPSQQAPAPQYQQPAPAPQYQQPAPAPQYQQPAPMQPAPGPAPAPFQPAPQQQAAPQFQPPQAPQAAPGQFQQPPQASPFPPGQAAMPAQQQAPAPQFQQGAPMPQGGAPWGR